MIGTSARKKLRKITNRCRVLTSIEMKGNIATKWINPFIRKVQKWPNAF